MSTRLSEQVPSSNPSNRYSKPKVCPWIEAFDLMLLSSSLYRLVHSFGIEFYITARNSLSFLGLTDAFFSISSVIERREFEIAKLLISFPFKVTEMLSLM